MAETRPDPDVLLAMVQREEAAQKRGRLKVFLGAAAGVGKTFAMLSLAREKRDEQVDVVVGVVETHGRAETAALLEGLETLPLRQIEYRGVRLHEFDLDAALKRRPALIVVDELAHTNAPGSRHPKRWGDVEELLEAGIDVYTALNVQHLDSLKDVVAGITGVEVAETVPDSVLDRANEIELVDLPPDELIERLREGKVYVPHQAERAIKSFFRKGNLIALRELALRRTAERVEEQMRDYREGEGIREVWQAGERILVCIAPGEDGERVIRAGRRLAATLHAEWSVVYVETPKLQRLAPEKRNAILEDLRLAERLGATTLTLSGPDVGDEIVQFARRKNMTKIVLGKPTHTGLQHWLFGSVVDTVISRAKGIDVYLIGGETNQLDSASARPLLTRSREYLGVAEAAARERPPRYPRYLAGVGIIAICTAIAFTMSGWFELVNLVMVYLLGVVVAAVRYGRGPSILVAVLGVGAFDFFFVPPFLTLHVADTQYLLTFAVMLIVGLTISNLTAGIRQQARVARYREERMSALYGMTRELAASQTEDAVLRVGVKHVAETFVSQTVLLLPDADGRIRYPVKESMHGSLHGADLGVAQWVYDRSQPAGLGTDTLAGAEAHYIPIIAAAEALGVAAILPANPRRLFVPEQHRLLEVFINQIGLALERVRLTQQAGAVEIRVESERLRNSLLSAISHDLRTPLATIVGAASSLAEQRNLDDATRSDLARAIHDEARRMTRLVNNILDMARLEGGVIKLDKQWYPLEELTGGVLTRLKNRLQDHPVRMDLPPNLPWLYADAVLIEQVIENLIENAVKYTPEGTPITLSAQVRDREFEVSVADRGPGLASGDEERVFDKFYRARHEGSQSGVGLGLTICRAIVEAHGGRVWAEHNPQGGAVFRFVLPIDSPPPATQSEAELAAS